MSDLVLENFSDSLGMLSHAELGRIAADAECQAAELRAAGNHAAAWLADSIGHAAERALLTKVSGVTPD